jgi:hypothetical protein
MYMRWAYMLLSYTVPASKVNLSVSTTGFDAHDDDPLAECELQDEDYHWVTAEILASCGRVEASLGQPVRYLSVLEGGYDIPAIQRSAVCHVRAMLEGIPETTASAEGAAQGGEVAPKVERADTDVDTEGREGDTATRRTHGAAGPEVREEGREDGELAAMMEFLAECGISGSSRDAGGEQVAPGSGDDLK